VPKSSLEDGTDDSEEDVVSEELLEETGGWLLETGGSLELLVVHPAKKATPSKATNNFDVCCFICAPFIKIWLHFVYLRMQVVTENSRTSLA